MPALAANQNHERFSRVAIGRRVSGRRKGATGPTPDHAVFFRRRATPRPRPMPAFQTLDDLDDGQRVLVRLDLNSPVEGGEVQDNRRFSRHAGTVRELLDRDFAVALMAHQGRPGRDTFVSLEQHADILADHVGRKVATEGSNLGTSERAEPGRADPGGP